MAFFDQTISKSSRSEDVARSIASRLASNDSGSQMMALTDLAQVMAADSSLNLEQSIFKDVIFKAADLLLNSVDRNVAGHAAGVFAASSAATTLCLDSLLNYIRQPECRAAEPGHYEQVLEAVLRVGLFSPTIDDALTIASTASGNMRGAELAGLALARLKGLYGERGELALTNLETLITRHLDQKWNPEIILLGGSRAAGQENSNSDWDLFLLGNYPACESYPEQYSEQHLDVQVRPLNEIENQVLKIYYGPVAALRVLKDRADRLGARIVESTKSAYQVGPEAKSQQSLELDRSEMLRFVAKLRSHASDPEACFTTLGFVHRLAIQIWFECQRRWSLPPHKALPIIRKEDPEFAKLLSLIAGDHSMQEKLHACSQIQALFEQI